MPDLLVKLYTLPPLSPITDKLAEQNIIIRPPIGPENYAVIGWIRSHFGAGWAGEAENAFFRSPKSVFVAVRETTDANGEIHGDMLGFACYDATVKGFFGPTGVDEKERGHKGSVRHCSSAVSTPCTTRDTAMPLSGTRDRSISIANAAVRL